MTAAVEEPNLHIAGHHVEFYVSSTGCKSLNMQWRVQKVGDFGHSNLARMKCWETEPLSNYPTDSDSVSTSVSTSLESSSATSRYLASWERAHLASGSLLGASSGRATFSVRFLWDDIGLSMVASQPPKSHGKALEITSFTVEDPRLE